MQNEQIDALLAEAEQTLQQTAAPVQAPMMGAAVPGQPDTASLVQQFVRQELAQIIPSLTAAMQRQMVPSGRPGQDGRTPIKGVDYRDGRDGRDGKDGVDGKIVKTLIRVPENRSSEVEFAQSGTGAIAEAVQAALRRLVYSGQFDTAGHYNTQKITLTGTMAIPALEVIAGGAVKMSFAAHQDTNYVTGDASAGGCLDIYSQLTSSLHDLVLLAQGTGDIHVGNVEGGTGAFFVDMNIKVASWNNGTRGHGLQVTQEDNSVVMEFPYSGGIIEMPGVLRGGNGANDDTILRNGSASGLWLWLNAAGNSNVMYLSDTGTLRAGGAMRANEGTAIPAGGTAGAGLLVSSTDNFGVFFGSGAPSLTAAKGSLYMRSDGSSTSTRMYVNTDGGTTWTNVVTAA